MSASPAAARYRSSSSGCRDPCPARTAAGRPARRPADGAGDSDPGRNPGADRRRDGQGRAGALTPDDLRPSSAPPLPTTSSRTIETSLGPVFVEIWNPPLRLVVVGAVHIAQALAPMAALAGYKVTVIDPRSAFASAERFPGVEIVGDWPDDVLPGLKPDKRTAIVTLTHDPKIDDPALAAALRSDAFYIGALGSRKTHAKRGDRLAAAGFGASEIARIRGPVGLAIGALTPAEIALSILAEVTAVLHRAPLAERQRRRRVIFDLGRHWPRRWARSWLHAVKLPGQTLRKGRVLTAADLAALAAAPGIAEIIAARRWSPPTCPRNRAALPRRRRPRRADGVSRRRGLHRPGQSLRRAARAAGARSRRDRPAERASTRRVTVATLAASRAGGAAPDGRHSLQDHPLRSPRRRRSPPGSSQAKRRCA